MKYKGCVVIQGEIRYPELLPKLRECWNGYQLIFSTWNYTPTGYFNSDDVVIYNSLPEMIGKKNFNLQKVSTIEGMRKAKELGWERAIKWRPDFLPKSGKDLAGLFSDGFNVYAWVETGYHRDPQSGYITDFFMEGECDDIINLFDVNDDGWFPEYNITERLFELGLNDRTNVVCNHISGQCDVWWEKWKYWLSGNISMPQNHYKNVIPNETESCHKFCDGRGIGHEWCENVK